MSRTPTVVEPGEGTGAPVRYSPYDYEIHEDPYPTYARLRAEAPLYRNPDLRRIIEEHRARGKEAHTLSGLTTEIAHLRIALDAIATTVRRHEEEIRRLRKPKAD